MSRSWNLLRPAVALVIGLVTLASFAGVASGAALAPRADRDMDFSAGGPRGLRRTATPPRRAQIAQRDATRPAPREVILAHVRRDMKITTRPGGGKVIGTMPRGSRYFNEPLRAWVLKKSGDGRYGKVTLPYTGSRATGWMFIAGLKQGRTPYRVKADLSRHSVKVMRLDEVVLRLKAATGAPSSPTPVGKYFVTDLVPIPEGGSFGTYAFGLSGIQTNLPAGWTGGDQLAIHGTNNPSSIGSSASAGCLRVSERALQKLERIIKLGTPVTIAP